LGSIFLAAFFRHFLARLLLTNDASAPKTWILFAEDVVIFVAPEASRPAKAQAGRFYATCDAAAKPSQFAAGRFFPCRRSACGGNVSCRTLFATSRRTDKGHRRLPFWHVSCIFVFLVAGLSTVSQPRAAGCLFPWRLDYFFASFFGERPSFDDHIRPGEWLNWESAAPRFVSTR
jgi:hypothetical protein